MRHAWDERPVLYLTMIIRSKPRIATCAQLGLACVALARLLKATLHLLGRLIEAPDIDPVLKETLISAQKLHKEVFPEAVQFTRASGAKAEDWAAALSVAGFTMPKALSVGLVVPSEGAPAWEEGLGSKPDQTKVGNQMLTNSNGVCRHVPRLTHGQPCHFRGCSCHQRFSIHHSAPSSPSGSPKTASGAQVNPRLKPRSTTKDILEDLTIQSQAERALVEVPVNQRDLVEGLKKAAECKDSDSSLSEIAANLAPLLVARTRLHDAMKAHSNGTFTAKDKSTPWERTPWKSEAVKGEEETHHYHLLAQGTDVADLAIERLPENKKADKRIMRLTKPVVKDGYANGAWRWGNHSRPSSAGAAHSARRPCPPSLNGRIR